MSLFYHEDVASIFVGGAISGIIRRSTGLNNTYDISFRSIPARISVLKTFPVITGVAGATAYNSLYAAVGNVVYYLSNAGSWIWKYTHDEQINDMTFDDRTDRNVLYVISETGVTKINPLLQNKTIYLKLIDRAGNETVLDSDNKFEDSISISSLVNFISENQIFELNEIGNISYNLDGDNKFYSADKIEEERGEYISEIFDGTNDLVKWDILSWQVVELYNTQVLMYVRTSTSQNDILIAEWEGPYYTYSSSGVDISHLSGQFLQFKAVLTSSEKGVTPTFNSASIRVITTEALHFFTTNFTMPSSLDQGILTSQKIVPVSADIVFAINTTNSVDWTDYQLIDENRIFKVNGTGQNLRVGIKFISPSRYLVEPSDFGEYGPYNSELYVNTIDFIFDNDTGTTNDYHFRISFYNDVDLNDEVFSANSADEPDGFSVDGLAIPEDGVQILSGNSVEVLFTTPGSANIICDEYYFVKIESVYNSITTILSTDKTYIAGCTSSFIDTVDFNFTNNETTSNYYNFRIKFYQDLERTVEYKTVFSGNDRTGWFVNDSQISEDGALVSSTETVNVVYRPDSDDYQIGVTYYLIIEAHDGDGYVFASNSYTFQFVDVQSLESCGGYSDVPIVKNFGFMFELDNNEFISLNM